MKKIIIIGPGHPYRGGIAAFNERLARELIESGNKVVIETFTLQYPSFLFPGKTQYSLGPAPEKITINRSINSIWPPNWLKVGKRIRREKPDIIIFKYWIPILAPCLGTIARVIKKNKKTRIITIIDNIFPHERRAGDNMLTKYFVKQNDGFIAMSGTVMRDLGHFDNNKPRLLSPHPVYDNFGASITREQAISNLGLDDANRYILFFGLIRDYKGLDLLIEAFSDRRLRDRGIKLLVAGEFYSSREIYEAQIMRHELQNEIIIYPEFVPDDEVANWFCAADLIVQPYKSATQSGITQIGYHFCKPMLVTDVGGLSEIIPHRKGGYVVSPEPHPIAEAIIDFFENNRYDEYVKGIISEKARFSWDSMLESIDKLLEEIGP